MTTVLVTGGGGFLAGAVVTALLEAGRQVRSLSRGSYPELEARGVESVRGDLASARTVIDACRGVDAVVHVAAKAGMWGPYDDYHRANVVGTENVLRACHAAGVGRLVFTSSPSVVFDGRDMRGVDESVPYPERYDSHYSATKAQAERMVLAANGPDLATCALRPHLIWGPGDNHLIPRLVARARAGRLRRVGAGTNLVDTVYVDNAARAHVLALDRLAPGSPPAGRAYFITNDDRRPLWDVVDRILQAAGLPPLEQRMSATTAYAVGWLCETLYGLFGVTSDPPMTRWVARELTTDHWFDIGAARRDLGYEPLVGYDEGMTRLDAWFAERRP